MENENIMKRLHMECIYYDQEDCPGFKDGFGYPLATNCPHWKQKKPLPEKAPAPYSKELRKILRKPVGPNKYIPEYGNEDIDIIVKRIQCLNKKYEK
jgi:hypothetical protein